MNAWRLAVLLLGLGALPSHAQDERDRRIAELLQRVEALEKRLAEARPAAPAPSPPAAAPTAAASPAPEEPEPARALERALLREGGLVLPPKALEVEAAMTYEHRSFSGLELLDESGAARVARQSVTRDAAEAALTVRAGLPWSTQVELTVPYASVQDRRAVPGLGEDTERWSGRGNIGLGITTQLANERGPMPGILGSLHWRRAADASASDVPGSLATAFSSFQGALTAVKRMDPLVFYGSVSHAVNRAARLGGRDVDPGDTTGLRFGGLFAVSPDASLRFGLDLGRTRKTTVDGVPQVGSDGSTAMLETGLGLRLTPRTMLGVQAGIGLTARSPDFRLGFSLPIRF